MDTLMCDVVGCGKPAAWARVIDLNATHEDFLCEECWKRLQLAHPHQGRCYAACADIERPADDGTAGSGDEVEWIEERIIIG